MLADVFGSGMLRPSNEWMLGKYSAFLICFSIARVVESALSIYPLPLLLVDKILPVSFIVQCNGY